MKFCSDCGHPVKYSIPEGDNLKRAICTQCSTIHYQNPRIIAGTLPIYENKILLCKRAIEPRLGYWTLPAGFMEEQETLEQGAVRETLEEAGITVECGTLLTSVSVPFISQVHIFFLAQMSSPEHASQTTESLEVKLFEFDQIPWDKIAFPTVKKTIKHFLNDLESGEIKTRIFDIHPSERIRAITKTEINK
jgi:ADP-ribose pyrophosphatase YjhB (NUDIX family)